MESQAMQKGGNGQTGKMHERYEVRLMKIADGKEECVESRDVPRDQLEAQIAQLPDREAMSLVNANVFVPVNLAAALNVLSDHSAAGAFADQYAPGNQST
jgi:hypothetical protein